MQSTFTIEKECKHSRRYTSTDQEFPIQTIYVNRSFADKYNQIVLSIQARSSVKDEEDEKDDI